VKQSAYSGNALVGSSLEQLLTDLEACRGAVASLLARANGGLDLTVTAEADDLAELVSRHRDAYKALLQDAELDPKLSDLDIAFTQLLSKLERLNTRIGVLRDLQSKNAALEQALGRRSQLALQRSWQALGATTPNPSAPEIAVADEHEDFAAILFRKLQLHQPIAPELLSAIRGMTGRLQSFARNEDIIRGEERLEYCTVLLDGLCARYAGLENGQRQITAIYLPGDFLDLSGLVFKQIDHGVMALTPARTARLPHSALSQAAEAHPSLMHLLFRLTAIEGAIHRRWLVAMGRLSSLGQAGHLFCELYWRLAAMGLASNHEFSFSISQHHLADMLGLSAVHVNRTLQQLRAEKLIEWQGSALRILDWHKLAELCEFDPRYLDLRFSA
jgi:CRP-like cAMP-binding protein